MDYSPGELSRATQLLSTLTHLQPLLFGLAEELLSVSLELNVDRLQEVMHSIRQQVRMEVKERDPLIHSCICLHSHVQTGAVMTTCTGIQEIHRFAGLSALLRDTLPYGPNSLCRPEL